MRTSIISVQSANLCGTTSSVFVIFQLRHMSVVSQHPPNNIKGIRNRLLSSVFFFVFKHQVRRFRFIIAYSFEGGSFLLISTVLSITTGVIKNIKGVTTCLSKLIKNMQISETSACKPITNACIMFPSTL